MQLKRSLSRMVDRVTRRDPPVVRVLRRDADRGQAYAQAALGDLYRKGTLARKNYTEAAKWYRRAAEQGDAHAQFNLGVSYTGGRGVPQDDAEAVKWYRLAADQGDGLARFNLGAMYSSGRGVPKDLLLAYMWFELSVARGTQAAAGSRQTIARQLSPHQVEQAEKLAHEWKPGALPQASQQRQSA
jgi:TPR repeat protein